MISWLFSAAWQWLLGRFGMSDGQKLGQAEVSNAVLKSELKEETDEAKAFADPDRSESVVDDELRRHAGK